MMAEKVQLYILADGEHCSPKCPFLTNTTDGVPGYVRKAYPDERIHICRLFGQLDHIDESGPGWQLTRATRAPGCVALEEN